MSEKWAEKDKRKSLINQRKHLWTENMIKNIAGISGMQPGFKLADIGCGLGYLGMIYSPFFPKGSYTGVDVSKKLLNEAEENSKDWASDIECRFVEGSAYKIPLENNSMDITMCQTLLMHLNEPDKALKEMIRITKPGGIVLCKEPDNVSAGLRLNCSSMPDYSFEDRMTLIRSHLLHEKGRKALGEGDWQIGAKVLQMMQQQGLGKFNVVCNDLVRYIIPPYSSPMEQHLLALSKESISKDKKERDKETKRYRAQWKKRMKAGGASDYFIRKVLKMSDRLQEESIELLREQLDESTFFSFSGAGNFYCTTGQKPIS